MDNSPGITLLGLGPGDADLLTRQAWEILETAPEIYLRTRHHPVVASLPQHLIVQSFDDLYEKSQSFADVYTQIVDQVLLLGRRPQGVIYGLPGHPCVAEKTSLEIIRRASQEGLPVRIINGLSFIEPVFSTLGIDPLPQIAIIDALELILMHVPSFPPDSPALISQIYSPSIASEVKIVLTEVYPDEHRVQLVHAAGTSQVKVENLCLYEIDRSASIGLQSVLYIPALEQGNSFESFHEIIARLRAPDGCPWDREQTHQTLRSHLLEETYEVLSALDRDDPVAMREEFGDLLLQIVLQTQIANESGEFTMSEVIKTIHDKIVRRHPHVFSDVQVDGVRQVLENWENIKAVERLENGKTQESSLDGVADSLPALAQAEEYQRRAARFGFDYLDLQGLSMQIERQFEEFRHADRGGDDLTDALGNFVFAIVGLAYKAGIDAESALRQTNAMFRQRFRYLEQSAVLEGKNISELSPENLEILWQSAGFYPPSNPPA